MKDGWAQTVLGPVDAADLGITLAHDHVLMDGSFMYVDPPASVDQHFADEQCPVLTGCELCLQQFVSEQPGSALLSYVYGRIHDVLHEHGNSDSVAHTISFAGFTPSAFNIKRKSTWFITSSF